MKRLMILILAVVLMVGVAYAKGLEVNQKAGDYNVEIRLDKNPPVVGNNNVTVTVKDVAGKYVTDAKVKVEYSMPAMPGMAAMNYKTDAMLNGQTYTAKMNLSSSGPWNIAVKITKGGKTSTVKFNVDAQ
ncbi:MAG: FixH family protein [Nitrospirae bacterium]|nr:FixH family protein [Nitrospirota bacterium]